MERSLENLSVLLAKNHSSEPSKVLQSRSSPQNPSVRDGRLFTVHLQIDLLGVEFTDLWGWHPIMQLTALSDTKYPFQSTKILGVSANTGKVSSSTIWSTTYKLHWLIISKSSTWSRHGKGKISSEFGQGFNQQKIRNFLRTSGNINNPQC